MVDWGWRALRAGAMLCGLGLTGALANSAPVAPEQAPKNDFSSQIVAADVLQVIERAFESGEVRGRPFAVVDKKQARIYVFDAEGRLAGIAPSLLGLAKGDESAPGVASKIATGIPLGERTTPAGRFESEPGRNIKGEAIVWVDYAAAIAIHRLRPAPAAEQRPQRLASANPEDRRISLGCIVVAPEFYDSVIAATLGRQRGVVYVLPDARLPDARLPGARLPGAPATQASARVPGADDNIQPEAAGRVAVKAGG